MICYHATAQVNEAALLSQGAIKELSGSNAGTQAGKGFYLATTLDEAKYWAEKLFNSSVSILAVTLPGSARIASIEDQQDKDVFFRTWLLQEKYGTIEGDSFTASEKAYEAHGIASDEADPIKSEGLITTLFGLYLQSLGYDGYVVPGEYDDTIIIINFDLLSIEAFKVAETYMPAVWR